MKISNKTITALFISISVILFLFNTTFSQETAGQLFEKALYKEEATGDLQQAIDLYQEILQGFPDNRSVSAEALLHVGLCYEKMGSPEAYKTYQDVINKYSDQEKEVAVAQERLSELTKNNVKKLSVIDLYEKRQWIENSSLSPDGTKIAGIDFSVGQNIVIYDRSTNETKMLTNYNWFNPSDGYTYFPVWSPDGQELIYMYCYHGTCEIQGTTFSGEKRTLIKNSPNCGQIYPKQWPLHGNDILAFKQDSSGFYTIGLVPAKGGSFKALCKTQWKDRFIKGDASMSPDGKFVVFADQKEDNFDLFIINTNGGNPTVLNDQLTNDYNPLWSPDGKYIAFIREIQGGSFLYAIKMEGGQPAGLPILVKEGMQNTSLITWTDQGICYDFSLILREIHTLSLDPQTGSSTGVPEQLNYTPVGSNICPVWSYDGKYLAFISYNDKPEVVIQGANGGKTQHFSIPTDEFWAPSVHDLRWLPDNSGVGFNILERMGNSTLYRINVNSGKWQKWPLPTKSWTRTDWGPDENSFIFFKTGVEAGFYQHNFITVETKQIYKPESVNNWYGIRGLKFSRDHQKLVYLFANSEITILDIQTGSKSTIGQKYRGPTFSPDGQKVLAFCLPEPQKKNFTGVTILSSVGEILQQYDLSEYFEPGTNLNYPDWSPNGDKLVFGSRNMKFYTYLMKNVLE